MITKTVYYRERKEIRDFFDLLSEQKHQKAAELNFWSTKLNQTTLEKEGSRMVWVMEEAVGVRNQPEPHHA